MSNNTITSKLADKTIDFESSLGQEIKKCDGQVDLKLKRFVENIEKLEEEKRELSSQVSFIYKEAKAFGFDNKAMKEVIRKRKMDLDKRVELENLTETYKESLGMLT